MNWTIRCWAFGPSVGATGPFTNRTDIEWTNGTWNPVTGCDQQSPGCDHCYALRLAARLQKMGSARYAKDGNPRTSGPGFGVTLHWDKITEPLHLKKPQRIFVNSMSDLFHREVTLEFLQAAFATMVQAHWHTFLILTKRAKRLRALAPSLPWPPHIWMGVSIELSLYFYRIHDLCQGPAARRFLSVEPLLAPLPSLPLHGIDLVIVGGESGPGARPMDPDWARDIRDQCQAAGVAFFMKQMARKAPIPDDLMIRQYPEVAQLSLL